MRIPKAFLLLLFFVSTAVAVRFWGSTVNALHFSLQYRVLVFVFLLAAFFLLVKKDYLKYFKPFYFVFFLAVWVMPFLRCRFRVPFFFCHACPGKCAWGIYRSSFVPVFLALNLDGRFWCWHLCPLGQVQDKLFRGQRISLPLEIGYLRFGVLFLLVITVLLNLSFGFQVAYNFTFLGFILLIFLLVGSVFMHRSFCTYLCPLGAFSDLVLSVEKKMRN